MILYPVGHFLFRIIGAVFFRHRVIHRERLIEDGPALLVCNHASFLDPPLLGICFRKPVHYLARKSIFVGPLAWLLPRVNVVPVDRGKGDMGSLKRVLELVKSGERVVLFPEGTRTRDGELQTAEAGIGFLIAKSGVPVQPLRLFGTFETFPRHAKFPRPGRVTVVVGERIDFSDVPAGLHGRPLYDVYAERVMAAIGALRAAN